MKKFFRVLMPICIVCFQLVFYSNIALAANYEEPFELPKLTGNWREDYVAVAKSQIGYTEAEDGSSYFGAWADQTYRPWCSEFAAWCAEQAGISETVIPVAKSTAGYRDFFIEEGRFYYLKEGIDTKKTDFMNEYINDNYYDIGTISIKDVEKGDIILKETNGDKNDGPDHTGIFLDYKNGQVEYISGNSSDNVEISTCSPGELHAVCKPDFEQNDKDNTSDDENAELLENNKVTETGEEEIDTSEKANIEDEPVSDKVTITMQIGSLTVDISGDKVQNDVAPIIVNNRTMLPIRVVAENLGANVYWNDDKKTVEISDEDTQIEIVIESNKAIVNGKTLTIDSPATIINNRTYVPIRFVAENLGAEVDWNNDSKEMVITK